MDTWQIPNCVIKGFVVVQSLSSFKALASDKKKKSHASESWSGRYFWGGGHGVLEWGIQECFPIAGEISAEIPPCRGSVAFQRRSSGCSPSKAKMEPSPSLSGGRKWVMAVRAQLEQCIWLWAKELPVMSYWMLLFSCYIVSDSLPPPGV